MYILTLIKVSNQKIGRLSPLVKKLKNVASCTEILLKPKSR